MYKSPSNLKTQSKKNSEIELNPVSTEQETTTQNTRISQEQLPDGDSPKL
jgi:hypothetical protein